MGRTTPILGVLIIATILSGATAFIGTSMRYIEDMGEKEEIISSQREIISDKDAQIIGFVYESVDCSDCHGEVKDFHTTRNISILDKIRGKNPRLCTTCHSMDSHDIHVNLINREELDCEDCHLEDTPEGLLQFRLITPKPRPGDILVCEQCHEEGNYMDIHLESGTCANCHMGDIGDIHKPTMANIGELIRQGG